MVWALLSFVTPLKDCFSQIPSAEQPVNRSVPGLNQSVFDKLELFGFFAIGPNVEYARRVVQQRGTNFTPDEKFIASFPSAELQSILRNVRPRTPKTLSPDRERAYELLQKAQKEAQLRSWAAASEHFEQALQLAPTSSTLHLVYAVYLIYFKSFSEAETQARQSLKLWPDNATGHATLAASLAAQKKFAEAEAESRDALRISPKDHSAIFTLGLALAHQHKYQDAIPFLEDAIVGQPNWPELKKLLGISLIETGEVVRGIDQLNVFAKTVPDDAEGHYYLGVGLRLKGSSGQAQKQFDEALRLQPENPQFEAAAHPDTTQWTTDSASGPKPEDGSVSANAYNNNFFGFTYQFPQSWVVLDANAAVRALLEVGMALMSTGDPAEVDSKKVAERVNHALLFAADGRDGNQSVSMETVMVTALDIRSAPGLTPRFYLQTLAQQVKQTRAQTEFSETPREVKVGGKSFWKTTFVAQTSAGTRYGSQFALEDKGYLLQFTFGSLDPARVPTLEKSLESIHFLDERN